MTKTKSNLIVQTAFFSFIAVFAAIVWFVIGLSAWEGYHTEIAFQSLLGFIAITGLGVAFLANRERFSPFLIIIQGFLLFATSLHTGFAINTIYQPETASVIRSSHDLLLDLVELSILGFMILLAVWAELRWSNQSPRILYAISIVTSISLLLLYAIVSEDILYTPPAAIQPIMGLPLAILAAIEFIVAIILVNRRSDSESSYNVISLTAVCVGARHKSL